MKKIIPILIYFSPLIAGAQNIFTVSNIPGITAKYRSLQGAIDSVPVGSTIIVFPSAITYGDVVINKQVAIYGNGYFLTENAPPNTAYNTSGVIVSTVSIKKQGSFSTIEGLTIQNTAAGASLLLLDTAANITVSRCLFNMANPHADWFIQSKQSINCTFKNCYFDEAALPQAGQVVGFLREHGDAGNTESSSRGMKFMGNIINIHQGVIQLFADSYPGQPSVSSDISFLNNTIITGIGRNQALAGQFCDYTYINNIFYVTYTDATYNKDIIYNFQKTVTNNVSNVTGLFPSRGKNLEGVALASLFSNNTTSTDGQWKLTAASPAMTYATDGRQAGAFGGDYPYVLSGIPDLPAAYSISVTNDTGNPGRVKVTVKSQSSY